MSVQARILAGFLWAIVLGFFVVTACITPTDTGGTNNNVSSTAACNTGYCLNNRVCCPRAFPNYTYGGHGYAAGCYASCPYVGDCGSSTQCF